MTLENIITKKRKTANLLGELKEAGRKAYDKTVDIMPAAWKPALDSTLYSLSNILNYGRADMFYGIAIETTSVCNRRCSYCPNSCNALRKLRPQKHMDKDLFDHIVDQLADMKYKGVIALQHYGEPLLDPDLTRRIAQIKEKVPTAQVFIYSNGDFLTPGKLDDLIEAGLDRAIITNHNQDGSRSESLTQLENYLANSPDKRRYATVRHKIIEKSNRGGLVEVTDGTLKNAPQCTADLRHMYITVNGDVALCCNSYLDKENNLGNVAETGLLDIWKSYVGLRKELNSGKHSLAMCRYCAGAEKPMPLDQRIDEYKRKISCE